MWAWLANLLAGGGAAALPTTAQAASTAGNMAAGAADSGWGKLAGDMAKGNYASAAGNALEMGRQNPVQTPQIQSAQSAPIPSYQPTAQTPLSNGNSPYLPLMMSRYLGGR